MLVSPFVDPIIAGIFGLLLGSFLNVVIYRLPKMMEQQWQAECAEMTGQPVVDTPVFNLVLPRSQCRDCGHAIRWFENIPVASYVVLRGRCSACKTRISPRYPAVEIVTAGLFAALDGLGFKVGFDACSQAFYTINVFKLEALSKFVVQGWHNFVLNV